MNYPNSKRTYVKANISTSNRGMSLEDDINLSSDTYISEERAVIHKKPTPITIVNVDYPKRSAAKITEAYFKLPSTTDYNGIYNGKYIDFEAKECNSKTSFPYSYIHEHQIRHLKQVLKQGAIAFIIIRMNAYETDYLIKASEFIDYYENSDRKSIPYEWIDEKGYKIYRSGLSIPCDYLTALKEAFKI